MNRSGRRSSARTLALTTAEIMFFGFLPVVAVVSTFAIALGDLGVPDFEFAFYGAAQAVVEGASPYPGLGDPALEAGVAYVYPPLTALLAIPFTAFPVDVARVMVMVFLGFGVAGILLTLGVRDWRCYGLAFLWPPILSAIQTGNITIPLALAAALLWRFRDRSRAAGITLGVALAAKVILWPLALWLGVTRRRIAVAIAVVVGAITLVLSWASIGFAGLRDYPDLLRRLQELEEPIGYTIYALALDLGASSGLARGFGLAVGVAVLAGVVLLARGGDHRRAFVLAVAAILACSPIVWLHYFALLLVAVAVAQPTLGPAWFVPLAMYASTGTHNGTTGQTAITIAAAALTVVLAMWPARSTTRRFWRPTTSPA